MLLADLGADVIKVEPPDGDVTRAIGAVRPGRPRAAYGGYFASVNRNKRSVVPRPQGPRRTAAALRELVARRRRARRELPRRGDGAPGPALRGRCAQRNPRLVYAALRGFGDPRTGESPYVDWPAFDIVAQAMGGLIGITGTDAASRRSRSGPGIGDIFPATLAAFGILAAVRHAEAHRRGPVRRRRDVRRHLALCERIVYQHSYRPEPRARRATPTRCSAPTSSSSTRDGAVADRRPDRRPVAAACAASSGGHELGTDARYAHQPPPRLEHARAGLRRDRGVERRPHDRGGRRGARRPGARAVR